MRVKKQTEDLRVPRSSMAAALVRQHLPLFMVGIPILFTMEVLSGGVKLIEMQDNVLSLQAREVSGKAFYRLQVTRNEGPP